MGRLNYGEKDWVRERKVGRPGKKIDPTSDNKISTVPSLILKQL